MESHPKLDPWKDAVFFKAYIPSIISKRLKIPAAFLKYLEGVTTGTVSLTGPSGVIWDVGLSKRNDEVFLEEGWPRFVADHFINLGDFLVFRYKGNLHFTVQIFDDNAVEKESAFNAVYNKNASGVDEHNEKGVMVEVPPCHVAVDCSAIDNLSKVLEGIHCKSPKQSSKRSIPRPSQRRNVTMEERNRVIARAEAFQSENPFVHVLIQQSHIYGGYLTMPSSFSVAYLPKCRQEMILRGPNETCWPVRYIVCTDRCTLSKGWRDFIVGNSIEAGDVCIFELVKPNELQIHLYRAVSEISPDGKETLD